MKNYTNNKIGKTLNFDDLESVCGGGPKAFLAEYHGNHSNGHPLVHSKNEQKITDIFFGTGTTHIKNSQTVEALSIEGETVFEQFEEKKINDIDVTEDEYINPITGHKWDIVIQNSKCGIICADLKDDGDISIKLPVMIVDPTTGDQRFIFRPQHNKQKSK